MTISNENSKDVFDIDGASAMLYSFTFDITDPSEVFVELFDSNGNSLGISWTRVTSPTPANSEYFVDEDNSQVTIGGVAGTIQAEYGDVDKLVIIRSLPLTQSSAFPNATAFNTISLEARLDKITLITQQLQEQLDRSLLSSPTDTSGTALELPAASDGKGLFWNGAVLANTANDIETIDDSATSAAEAAVSAAEAAASAASVNLPTISGGDATKHLQVNAGETGYDFVTLASLSANKLPLAGGVMTGPITGLAAPAVGSEATNKTYVDGRGIRQQVSILDPAVNSGTTILPVDDTAPPQITEGDEYMTRVITPESATSILKIDVVANVAVSAGDVQISAALFKDTDANALAAVSIHIGSTASDINKLQQITFTHFVAVSGAGARTYRVRIGPSSAATVTFNGQSTARIFGGVIASSLTVTEIN